MESDELDCFLMAAELEKIENIDFLKAEEVIKQDQERSDVLEDMDQGANNHGLLKANEIREKTFLLNEGVDVELAGFFKLDEMLIEELVDLVILTADN